MGLLDRARKLAEQARNLAEQVSNQASDAMADAATRAATSSGTTPPTATTSSGSGPASIGPVYGTAYVPGMLGRPGWREQGLTDPAALLPIEARHRVGVPHTTKSQILEEPFGMGRRWTSGGRSAALFYQLYPDHQAWEPPGGRAPLPDVSGASMATMADGRMLVFLAQGAQSVVLEIVGIDESARSALAQAVAERLARP